MPSQRPIPVIDLFAGPGGLGEGFSSILDSERSPLFSLKVSAEKDPTAHKTLSLRALYRTFPRGKAPDCYYDYIRGDIVIDPNEINDARWFTPDELPDFGEHTFTISARLVEAHKAAVRSR